jgi:hypothetical protein
MSSGKYAFHPPNYQASLYLSEIADELFPGRPVTFKDEFVRAIESAISEWIRKNGGPSMLLSTQWGLVDSRLRIHMRNENCATLQQLARKSDKELLQLHNFGHGCLKRLRELTTGEKWKDPRWEKWRQQMEQDA